MNVFERQILELLSHAGVTFTELRSVDEIRQSDLDILLVALEDGTAETSEAIWTFAEHGGTVVAYGGLHRIVAKLGCSSLPPMREGYLLPDGPRAGEALRFLPAEPLVPASSAAGYARWGSLASSPVRDGRMPGALSRFRIGNGWLERWAVNIPATVAGLQQGLSPVLRDGIPPGDGSAQIDEGILKADDGIELNWEPDRRTTDTEIRTSPFRTRTTGAIFSRNT